MIGPPDENERRMMTQKKLLAGPASVFILSVIKVCVHIINFLKPFLCFSFFFHRKSNVYIYKSIDKSESSDLFPLKNNLIERTRYVTIKSLVSLPIYF